jgi:hypothetical protein
MPHIPYVDPETVTDPEIKDYLERARREGTPRPEKPGGARARARRHPCVFPSVGSHFP